jgi:hypothetical protein
VTATRGQMHGTAQAGEIGWVLAAGVALVVVFAPLTHDRYRHKR